MSLDRAQRPSFKSIPSIAFPWPIECTLQPTTKLFIWQEDTGPLLSLHMLLDSGSWHEPVRGVAYLSTKMLLEGTQLKNYQQISSCIDHYGASLSTSTGPDYTLIKLVCLAKHATPMVELLSELLCLSIFPTYRMEQVQHLTIQSLKVENEKSHIIAYRHFKEALLGREHPYGNSMQIEDIQAVTQGQLVQYYQKNLLNRCTILLTGADASQCSSTLQKCFSSLPQSAVQRPAYPMIKKVPIRKHFTKEGSLQSAICVGKLTIPKTHPDYISLYITTALLGGYFGSRLMRNIREKKGYTYHIHASLVPLQETSFFLINTEAIQQYAQQTCQEIYREIERLQNEWVSMEEIITLRNYLLGNFLSTTNDPFGWVKRFKEVHIHGLDQNFYQQFYRQLHTISPEEINAVAKQYWAIESLTEITVG